MNHDEFEQFVRENGKDILRFSRMTTGDEESGNELYQDTMLKLTERLAKLDSAQNPKSYALSVLLMLWKNKKKKYAVRNRIVPLNSYEECLENGDREELSDDNSPEQIILSRAEQETVRSLVAELPKKYRLPLYMQYSADMKMEEIAESLHLPVSTVKTHIRRAKQLLKEQLENIGYDR